MKELLKALALACLLLTAYAVSAQKYTISGYLEDSRSGEKLIGANIFEKSTLSGTTTNSYGFFSITLPKDSVTLVFSYIGYTPEARNFILDQDIQINIMLNSSLNLDAVEVTADRVEKVEETTQMSSIKIPIAQIKKLPALLGEVDVLKIIQLLPGVQSGTEGASGIYVRGGGPDQNLILLDGVPVYNVSHLFGFFSVFNADAIKNVELIKGGFPARYGGRLSSVLEINMKDGNMHEFHGEGSIGMVASKLTLEGPIIKDKTSFIVSGRRTYIDLLLAPLIKVASGDPNTKTGYYFYDVNAKLNHKLTKKDRLYWSIYTGDDKFFRTQKPYSYLYDGVIYEEEADARLAWGNVISALKWNRQINSKTFSNLALTYTRYNFLVGEYFEKIERSDTGVYTLVNSHYYNSGIKDWAARFDFDYLPTPDHFVKYGISAIHHTFSPGATQYKYIRTGQDNLDSTIGSEQIKAGEFAAYIEDDVKVNNRIKANIGIHYSGFLVNSKYYNSIQPRLAARYLFDGNWSAKISYAHMQQYIHLLTNSSIGLPTDLWVPATDKIAPQKSHQVALGVAKSFKDEYEITVEGYYKIMNDIIEYREGATFLNTNDTWENKVDIGKGHSYGAEVFIQKKFGETSGWIGYTLAWSNRQFDNINGGEVFPYKYDRRHDISIAISQKLSEKYELSAAWVYGTGNAVTLPIVRYNAENPDINFGQSTILNYDKKNNYRMAAYHRLDISLQQRQSKEKNWQGQFVMSVYNVYNRKNPFYYYIGTDNRGNLALRRVSLFPFIPSLSYNFKF